MMKKIELSFSQLVFILEKLPHIRNNLIKGNSSIHLLLKDEDIGLILEELSDLFSEIGLREDSEPNETGYFIESTIDDFNRVLHQNS